MATALCLDGHPNPAGANFCSVCGKAIPASSLRMNAPEGSAPTPEPPDVFTPGPPDVVPPPAPTVDSKERRKVPLAPVVIGAIILSHS